METKNIRQQGGLAFKNFTISEIKTDDSTRMVEGYFAAKNNIDSDADKIMDGAFQRSIEMHGPDSPANRKIAHLAVHDTRRPVGVIKVLREDDHGLYFRSKMGTHTDGEDAFRMYKEGLIREHSIGFNYVPDAMRFIENEANPEKSYFEIYEVKLWEGSWVVFGANSETPNLTGGKSKEEIDNILNSLNERMDMFTKALTDKNYSEKFNRMAEFELMQIKMKYNELINMEPIDKRKIVSSKENSKSESKPDQNLKSIINQLKF